MAPDGPDRENATQRPSADTAVSRRRRILRAAERLFAERGYDGVTVRDVAEAAGATHPLIYYHFGAKRELLAAVLDSNQTRVRGLTAGMTDPREAILTIVRNSMDEGRHYLLIMARSFLGGMPVVEWPGGYPGMEAAVRVLIDAGPPGDAAWEQESRGVVSLVTAMLCGWVLMGDQIMEVADIPSSRREAEADRLLAAIDEVVRTALAKRREDGA